VPVKTLGEVGQLIPGAAVEIYYPGLSHGLTAPHPDLSHRDLLAFIPPKGKRKVRIPRINGGIGRHRIGGEQHDTLEDTQACRPQSQLKKSVTRSGDATSAAQQQEAQSWVTTSCFVHGAWATLGPGP